MRVLVLSNVWVEPASSAAGRRMLQLLQLFLDQGWQLCYATTAKSSAYASDLKSLGIEIATIAMNDEGFNAFAKAYHPNIVLFDRFMVEEQFGWRIAQECPTALRVLDTEDLHCLRKARQQALKEERPFVEADLVSDVAKREIASIYRCDLTFMISRFEMALLLRFFKVPETLLQYVPFLEEPVMESFIPFEGRQHFVSIGNFLHAPNWDATLQLKNEIWPLIRRELPQAQLHVYGAYPSEKVLQLHSEKEGFLIKGRATDAQEMICNARVLLAPLRFGAGLKGKFIDAMQCGTPSVTTRIGVEGMQGNLDWGGAVATLRQAQGDKIGAKAQGDRLGAQAQGDKLVAQAPDNKGAERFAKAAVQLYTNKTQWQQAQENGVHILNTHFQKTAFEGDVISGLETTLRKLEKHREANFIGLLLQHHTLQSTKYMSKWIAEKNKL